MTTREEIREGLKAAMKTCPDKRACSTSIWSECWDCVTDGILDYLHSQGLRLPNGEALIDETNE